MTYYETGDIVRDDKGRILEITSGNAKWKNDTGAVAEWNANFVRAKEINVEPQSLWDLATIARDFIWFENRIVEKIKEKQNGSNI